MAIQLLSCYIPALHQLRVEEPPIKRCFLLLPHVSVKTIVPLEMLGIDIVTSDFLDQLSSTML